MIDSTNRNSALATALVEELARCGVTHAIAAPGSRSSPVTLALDREPAIKLEMVLDERCAGFVALGLALASGHPTVVTCTSGSATANLYPAVVEADQAGVPLIVLTSDRPPELRGIGAGQTIDQIKLFGDSVRWSSEIGTHDADDAGLLHYRASGCRAWGEATLSPGPVHLNLPWRDPLGPEPRPDDVTAIDPLALEGRSGGRPLTTTIISRAPTETIIGALTEALDRAERPLIVVWRQTSTAVAAAVARLSEARGLPLLAEPTSQLRLGPHSKRLLVSAYDLIARSMPERLKPDLVLRFGDMPTSKALRQWLGAEGGPDQIVIDPPGRWDEPTRRAGALIRCDAGALAEELSARSGSTESNEGFASAWAEAERAAQAAIDEVLASTPPCNEPGILRSLGAELADGDSLLLASSMPVRDGEAFMWGSEAAARVFANRGANGIDGLISTAAGISRATDGVTWLVLGDLALAHDLGGLAILTEATGPVRLVVIDNGGGGIFEFLPQASQVDRERFERLFITPSALDLERVAALFDLEYVEVTDSAELSEIAAKGNQLLHARTDRGENVELHSRMADAVTEAVSR